jgi:hypothetical protein
MMALTKTAFREAWIKAMHDVAQDGWDGAWWADSLEGDEASKYRALVERLGAAKTSDEILAVAKEIFQAGHEHGYELCVNLSCEG